MKFIHILCLKNFFSVENARIPSSAEGETLGQDKRASQTNNC